MSLDMICPECGGIIGAKTVTDQGRPCICFSSSTATTLVDSPSGVDNEADAFEPPPLPRAKVCCKCGVDLTGRSRLKDSQGYWCKDCHKADKAQNKLPDTKCEECGRAVLETALFDYDGRRICGPCLDEHKKLAKEEKKFRLVSDDAYREEDRKSMYIILGIFGVLVLIILLFKIGLI